jgi:hypothetical protein
MAKEFWSELSHLKGIGIDGIVSKWIYKEWDGIFLHWVCLDQSTKDWWTVTRVVLKLRAKIWRQILGSLNKS